MKKYVENPLTVSDKVFKDNDLYKTWCTWNYSAQLIEIFGEANKLVKFKSNNEDQSIINDQWDSFNRYCMMTFADSHIENYIKESLYCAYKDLYEYIYSSDAYIKSADAALSWFKQWMSPFFLKEAGVID